MSIRTKIIVATPMITVIIYLLLGYCLNAWHPGWIVFFAIPIVPMMLGTVTIAGLYPLLVVIAYLLMGLIGKLWHPGWIIFLTIPVVEIFLPKNKVVFNNKRKKKKKQRIFVYDEDDER
ncbi:MAG: hypothetical protein K2K48_05335 [Anaeroplasmataceae bacterium]|nr:hypothetical protein [Anaeroplasmataceae bacterium]MDE6414816.1 hypothetical protein [Anaeroplasmataceae bacterium]